MRSLAAALAVLVLSGLLLTRSSRAEPPAPEEERKLSDLIAAVAKEPGQRAALASLRWAAEVNGQQTVRVPKHGGPATLGQWGDNHAELGAIRALGRCEPLPEASKKAALALQREFGDALAAPLRAGALAQAGRKADAVALFTSWGTSLLPAGSCPGEHPMYSHRRVAHLEVALSCVEALEPKSPSVAKLKQLIERAQGCAARNHAVG